MRCFKRLQPVAETSLNSFVSLESKLPMSYYFIYSDVNYIVTVGERNVVLFLVASVCLCVCQSACMSVSMCQSVCVRVCLSVCLSLCLSAMLYL